MDIFLRVVGASIVLATLQDIFATVLFPGSRRGLVRKPLERGIWRAFRFVGRWTNGQRRRNLFAYCGPVQIVVALGTWLLLLTLGWAMIYQPALGTSLTAASGPTDTGWAAAIYYSGFNLSTLGVGDIVPTTGTFRLLTVAEAAIGFATITMVVTYFLSVYSALTEHKAFAQGLQHRTGNSGDAAELLAWLVDGADLPGAREQLESIGDGLRRTFQTHHSYPVLRYFHPRQPWYALPHTLLTTLDLAALLSSALDEQHARVARSAARNQMLDASLALLWELAPRRQPGQPSEEDSAAWQARYTVAVTRLARAGLHVHPDGRAGADEYVAQRAVWDVPLRDLAAAMGYRWQADLPAAPVIRRGHQGL